MSRKSAQRFCDNDMRRYKKLKRKERIEEIATRFRVAILSMSAAETDGKL
ncbi:MULTISPECIES: hypothetical protein [unclassified Ensifer]|nr:MULTISPECIES: hypothetical protein [unclassified Ensifer]